MDGIALSRARARLAEIRAGNEAEAARRQDEIYARLPEVRQIDGEMRTMMKQVIGIALKNGLDPSEQIKTIAEENLRLQDRKRAILSGAGYPVDYLDEIHSCPVCGDTGYSDGEICACLTKLCEQEQAKLLSSLMRLGNESFETFDLGKYDDDIIRTEVHTTARKWMARCLESFKNYARGFGEKSPNFLFTGGTGLGKTFSSACIAREVAKRGASVVYESVSGAVEPFEAIKFGRAEPDSESFVQRGRILDSDLLILDDLGTEMQTSFSDSVLYTIINSRLITGKKTIISTNLGKEELRARYGAQLASRLLGEYAVVPFVGEDIRLQKKLPAGSAGRAASLSPARE